MNQYTHKQCKLKTHNSKNINTKKINESINNNLASRNTSQRNIMSTDTLEIFNNSDEWASQLKHALS